jgi:hypothetical protein
MMELILKQGIPKLNLWAEVTKMATMRAKFQVQSVQQYKNGTTVNQETIRMTAVSGNKPYGPNGESEDNTYARWTPTGELSITITNPSLFDKLRAGDEYYLDFTKAGELSNV